MFYSSDPKIAGGVQEHVYYLCKYLKNLNVETTVFLPGRNPPLLPYFNQKRFGRFLEINNPTGYNLSFVLNNHNESTEKRVNKMYDLVHIHDPFMPFVFWDLIGKIKIPVVLTYHATWEKNVLIDAIAGLGNFLWKDMFKKTKGAIFVSERTRECWANTLSKNVLTDVIGNGIDRTIFLYKAKRKKKIKKVLFVGRIVPKKGLRIFLEAMKIIVSKRSDIKAQIIGKGPDEQKMKNYVMKNSLENAVSFLGYVDVHEKIRRYQSCDVFCAPYQNEGFGITLLESMATGTPIVALRNNAFSEVLKDYPDKRLILEKKAAEDLALSIENIIDDGLAKKKIRDWELKEAEKYDWKIIAEKTSHFYGKVIGNSTK